MIIFTGRPVFLDSAAAIGSMYIGILPPKPPPISIGMTRILETGSFSMRASWSRIMKGPWVESQTVSSPLSFQSAVPLCGSM